MIIRNFKLKYQNLLSAAALILIFSFFSLYSQEQEDSKLANPASIEDCIKFALEHNPQFQNSKLNQDYVETTISSKLSEWYPQIGLTANFQHNFELPASNFNGSINHIGSKNTSGILLGATQSLFNRDVIFASQSASDVCKTAQLGTEFEKIDLIVAVSKAFYNVIITQQQLKVVKEDIIRNTQSVKNAYSRFQSGVVDKTDYQRANIALNNSNAQKISTEEALKSSKAYLKQLMGYSQTGELVLEFDTTNMESQILIDTSASLDYSKRVEIQQLETQKRLQQDELSYYKWSFFPSINLFANYNFNFLNNDIANLYNVAYPNSYVGVSLSLPIFQGGKRFQQIRGAELLVQQIDNQISSFQNQINTQYQNAISEYKGNLNNYFTLKENLELAKEVYKIINLQYKSGVKTFLDVITAETDLRTAQINYYNSLYQVLSSKIDVEQALGNINY